jgi:hypothetical protein
MRIRSRLPAAAHVSLPIAPSGETYRCRHRRSGSSRLPQAPCPFAFVSGCVSFASSGSYPCRRTDTILICRRNTAEGTKISGKPEGGTRQGQRPPTGRVSSAGLATRRDRRNCPRGARNAPWDSFVSPCVLPRRPDRQSRKEGGAAAGRGSDRGGPNTRIRTAFETRRRLTEGPCEATFPSIGRMRVAFTTFFVPRLAGSGVILIRNL